MQQEGEPTSVRTDDEGLDEAEVVLTGAEALLPNDVVQASYRAMYMLARTRNPEGFIADWPGGPDEAVGAIGTQLQRLVDVAREHLQVTPLTRQTRELASSVRGGGHESS